MSLLVQANEPTASRRRVTFHLVDVTDGMTPETGEAGGQPQIMVDGAAFTDTGIGTLTHGGNGRYYADLTQAAVATAGTLIETRYKSANTAECPGQSVQVVGFDPASALSTLTAAQVNTEADTALTDYGALKPTVAGRTLDVSATGEAGVDWANVGSPTSTVNLSATTIATVSGFGTSAAAIAAAIAGTTLSIRRGDTVTINFTGLGNISARTSPKLWFTVKATQDDIDAAALIQVAEVGGLLYPTGSPYLTSWASIVVTNETTGAVTVTLSADLTSRLVERGKIYYDMQMLASGVVTTLTAGTGAIAADVTKAIA